LELIVLSLMKKLARVLQEDMLKKQAGKPEM
jgi:hypothetical protein